MAGVVALALTTIFYACLFPFHDYAIRAVFMDRGPTQYVTVLLGFWCVVSLLVKGNKLRVQRKALRYQVVPENHDFVLSSQTADQLIRNIHAIADLPEKFIVYNRILIAVANLKNLGRVSDVDDILRSIGERDESSQQTSFGTLAGFIWAIPVLGFIGTVLGLAQAIGRFSGLLDSQSDVSSIVSSLKDVTGGLSTAFETTLVALVIALLVQLWITAQRKAEEEFLDDCHEYCLKQIVSRIRILPYEQQRDL
ncbi:MotA/TolQ/ExbB proton channel family protein [Crateriforma conspicua]|uniref:MotA/TolQ/ExbB proton channel family protein n=1 Tax=Crateriforma conspicua TaxID=2527996 RepID=UPI001E29C839|nr:MotA/TolQ/ExbB proton channel family protein [Crateriforma conspicua]